LSPTEKKSETDQDQGQGDHEYEYATPAIGPPGQSFDPALTWFCFEIKKQRQGHQRDKKQKLKKPQMTGKAKGYQEHGTLKVTSGNTEDVGWQTAVIARKELPEGAGIPSVGNGLKVGLRRHKDK
jgi:hypothetical protein